MKIKYLASQVSFMFLMACGEPMDYYYETLEEYGYHPYVHPLEHSGSGTLLAGGVDRIDLISPPYSCFPKGEGFPKRFIDKSKFPQSIRTVEIDSDTQVRFLKTLASASPSIRGGIRIKEVKTIEFKAEDVSVEFFDSKEVLSFYKNGMDPLCKEFLQDGSSYVAQALKVGRMEFSFYRKNKGRIWIDAENVNQYLDFSTDLKWRIEDNFKLIIESPKFVAYQLGQIKKENNLISLYRTESKGMEEWDFYKLISIDENGVFKEAIIKEGESDEDFD